MAESSAGTLGDLFRDAPDQAPLDLILNDGIDDLDFPEGASMVAPR